MTNVGNLNATLSLSAFEFQRGLQASETAALQFAATTEVASRRAESSMKRVGQSNIRPGGRANYANMFQQLGYGIQDFSSQLNRGIGPAIGAVTNNIQAMAAGLGEGRAAAVAIGAAIGGIMLPTIVESILETKHYNEQLKESQKLMDRRIESVKQLAALEVKGGIGDARKGLEESALIAEGARNKIAPAFNKQMEAFNKAKKDFEAISYQNLAGDALLGQRGSRVFLPTAANVAKANEFYKQKELLEGMAQELDKINAEASKAREQLRQMGPGTVLGDKESSDEFWNDQRERYGKQLNVEDELRRKQLEDYGSEAQKADAKISAERQRLNTLLEGSAGQKEAMQRFESQSAVQMKKAEIADAQKKLAEMGQAAGMSAGVDRSSVAGVQAVNRAMAGSNSVESLAKEHLKVDKDALIKLEEIARTIGRAPDRVFGGSGA